jgi:predicted SnoaL-like aldol condensation-catalyzing enzyme
MSEANKRVIQRLLEEVWSKGDLSLLPQLVSDGFIGHFTPYPEPIEGLENYRRFIAMYQAAFENTRLMVEEQIAEGNRVATRWTAHVGDPLQDEGDDADTDTTSVMGISLCRLADGKIVESWDSWDTLSLLQSESGPDVLDSLSITI